MILLLITLYLLIGLISAATILAGNPRHRPVYTWARSFAAVALFWPLVILFGFVLHPRRDR